MKNRTAGIFILSLIAFAVLLVFRLTGHPPSRLLDDPAAVGSNKPGVQVAEAPPEVAVDAEPLQLQDFAGACFRTLRERNPRGRILALNANLGNSCSMIIETDEGSGRWMFDWRNFAGSHVREGELRWPDTWPIEPPTTGIDDAEFAPERLAALIDEARALWPPEQRADWLYEIIWLPAPFARPLVFIWFSDVSTTDEYDALTVIFDGTARLRDADYEQAYALHPATRFELREDHNFKGPLFESTALAESAVSLEGDPDAEAPGQLTAITEHCMHWLHTVNKGERVLRVGIDATRCFLLLENGNVRDDYYLFEASGSEDFTEHPSLIVEPLPTPNLLLDRSRLSAARVRERMQQATEVAGAGSVIERLAIAWVDGAMIWQFDVQRAGTRELIYLDEAGTVIEHTGGFPVTVHEREAGFADTRPAMPFVSESL